MKRRESGCGWLVVQSYEEGGPDGGGGRYGKYGHVGIGNIGCMRICVTCP